MKFCSRIAVFILIAGGGPALRAQLAMEINSAAGQVRFTGSDTITAIGSGPYGTFWGEGINSSGTQQTLSINAGNAAFTGIVNGGALISVDYDQGTTFHGGFSFFFASNPGSPTITGTGNWVSYTSAFANSSNRFAFEAWTGQVLPIGEGTGNSIGVTAVPEPSTYAAILGGLALAGAMIVRRRRQPAV